MFPAAQLLTIQSPHDPHDLTLVPPLLQSHRLHQSITLVFSIIAWALRIIGVRIYLILQAMQSLTLCFSMSSFQ